MAVIRKAFPRIEIREGGAVDAMKSGQNGANSISRIWVWSSIECRAAVVAQELYEYRFRIVAGLTAALAVTAPTAALAAFAEPLLWWLAPLAAWAAFVLAPQLRFLQRRKELKSHEIEVQAATLLYGRDPAAYRAREVRGMVGYAWLKKMAPEAIERAMVQRSGSALSWVLRNRAILSRIRDA